MNDEQLRCPDRGLLLRLAEIPDDASLAETAAHVFVCERCRRVFEDILYPQDGNVLTEGEIEAVNGFVQAHCTGGNPFGKLKSWISEHPVLDYSAVDLRWRVAAGPCVGNVGQAGEALELVFVSDQAEDGRYAWRATLQLESADNPNGGVFAISVEDRRHEPVAACELTICSQRVPIKDGKGAMSYQSFVAGLRDSRVKVKFPDGKVTSGALALF